MAGTQRLPPLPTVKEIIRLYKLRAVKQLSQNFLLDSKITDKIVKVAGGKYRTLLGARVCEVGPGPGTITRSILQKGAKHLVVVEKDRRFLPTLEMLNDASGGAMTIHHDDILRFDMSNMFPEEATVPWDGPTPHIYLIGNLPFSVSTPLIIKWLKQISERSGPWKYGRVGMTLTFQQEVGERMVAKVNELQRSRLSIMTQYLCDVRLKFIIKGGAFVPPPDVDVAVMHFIPKKEPLIAVPFELVEKLVRNVFHYRQKSCKYGLQTLFPPDRPDYTRRMLEEADVDSSTPSFMLHMEEFQRLCTVYKNICDENSELIEYNYRSHANAKIWKTPGMVHKLGL